MEHCHGTGGEQIMRFNGIDPREISPKVFVSHEIISSIPPRTVRMVSTSRQSYLAGVDLAPREVQLHLNFAGRSIDNANELAAQVATIFCRDTLSEYEPTHTPGKALSVILESASDPEWHWGFGVIQYTFKAPRPFYHSTSETIITGDDQVYIEPRGSVPCEPVITHRMAAAAASLVITISNGMTAPATIMAIRNPSGASLTAGQMIMIDFAARSLKINGEPAMAYVDYTASDWHPEILGGTLISLSDSGQTTVRWRDEWM